MSWADVLQHESEVAKLWDSTTIGWESRKLIGSAVDSFNHDPDIKKVENLSKILDKLDAKNRETLDAEIGLKKATYYDKLKAGLDAERTLLTQKTTITDALDDYMEVDAPSTVGVKLDNDMLDDYVTVADDEETARAIRIQNAMAFLNSCKPY